MDGKDDKHPSFANGRYLQEADDNYPTKSVEVLGPCVERRQPGKGLPAGHDRRKKSKRTTTKQVHGPYEDAGWMQRRGTSRTPGSE